MKKGDLHMWLTMHGLENSLELYRKIEQYGVALTEMGDVAYVHGNVTMETATKIIGICEQYGKVETELSMV